MLESSQRSALFAKSMKTLASSHFPLYIASIVLLANILYCFVSQTALIAV
jgi:ATP/ADP translocase